LFGISAAVSVHQPVSNQSISN